MSSDAGETDPSSADPSLLEDPIADFATLQSELHYRQAQSTLKELVKKLDLNDLERTGLEAELNGLSAMLDKLEQSVVHIAAFGMVGRGKSSLLNALLGQSIFQTGAIHGVTQTEEVADWRVQQGSVDGQIRLIDTPGIDEVAGESRELLAKQVAQKADLLLFIVSGDITQVEHQALSQLRNFGKPILLVFNKIDQYPEADRLSVYEKIRDERVKELLSPDEIVMASAAPLIPIATRQADGRLKVQMQAGKPQIEALKLKILEVLDREGKSLVALNSMLYADEVNEQIVQRKLKIRERNGDRAIWNAVMAKAVAVAVNPVTILDLLSSATIDIAMIISLSKLYGFPMTEQGAVGLLKNIAIAMGGMTASELLANLGLGTLKSLLGAATPATGGLAIGPYLAVAMTQAGVAGVATYGIGQVAKVYLANGANWGAESPKAVVTRILNSLDEKSILARIQTELRSKLDPHKRSPTPAKP
ncbi:MAG: GTP-binding protein [Synechococcales bacterium]|nr:GTP-binding protein [Synechococcales bacterium]